jgi:hypothetical protein
VQATAGGTACTGSAAWSWRSLRAGEAIGDGGAEQVGDRWLYWTSCPAGCSARVAVAGAAPLSAGTFGDVTTVHVPYTVEQDEDGVWSAHAWLGSSGGANGNGATPEEAVADLREAVEMVLDEEGIPAQLAQTLDLEVA